MKRYSYTIALLLILTISYFGVAQLKETSSKPNIILILADDLGYGDIGCYGSKRIETPYLDAMADEGMKFTQFYASSAVCTPTRVGVLTGKYPLRYSVSHHFNDREMYLDNTMLTIPKALKKQGYVSKHIGKWHLGGLNEKHILNREKSMPGPLQHGFDEYVAMIEDPLYRAPAMREKRLYKDAGKYLAKDDVKVEEDATHWTTLKFKKALEFIQTSTEKEQPFFLNLWLDAPHAPYEPSVDSLMDKYRDRTKKQDLLYRGMVSHLDQGVGAILNQLKKLEIADNTLVIFTSDNGPAYLGSPGYFKGRKTDLHEGGIRVPMIAWWPSNIQEGSVSEALSNTIDLLPTFMATASSGLDKDLAIDGLNLLPVFEGRSSLENRPTMFWEIATKYAKSGNYVNVTDVRLQPVANQGARKGDWKLLALEGKPIELYNIKEDPYERWNLLKQYPEKVSELKADLENWLRQPRIPKPY